MYRKFKAHLFNEFLYSGCEQLLETFSLFWIFWCPFLQPVQRLTIFDLASYNHNTTKLKTQSYQPDLKSTSFSTREFWPSSMLASSSLLLLNIHFFFFCDLFIIVVKAGSEVFVLLVLYSETQNNKPHRPVTSPNRHEPVDRNRGFSVKPKCTNASQAWYRLNARTFNSILDLIVELWKCQQILITVSQNKKLRRPLCYNWRDVLNAGNDLLTKLLSTTYHQHS